MLSLVDEVRYAAAFSFKYSPRPGTPAAEMVEDFVPSELADERLQRLQAAINRDQAAFNAATVGKRCEILLERPGRQAGQLIGKSPWLQSVHLATEAAIGALVEVEIVSAGPNSLGGMERGRAVAQDSILAAT